jgi:hypothetical protein
MTPDQLPRQPQGPLPPEDAELLDRLRDAWAELDPPPPGLAERAIVAIGMDDLDLELMLLQESASDLAGARGVETARTLTFSGESVSVMVTVTPSRRHHFRLDGWVAPLGGGRIHVRHSGGRDVDGEVDRDGRFVLHDVPAGMVQLVYHPRRTRTTDDVPLRPVAAPPVRLGLGGDA